MPDAGRLRAAVRREWWVVAIAVLAAAAAALLLGGDDSSARVARAYVEVDALTVGRTAGLPRADDVLAEARKRAGAAPKAFGAAESVRYSTIESPPRRIAVTARAEDAAKASAAAEAGAEWLESIAGDLGSVPIAAQKARVRETGDGLDELARVPAATDAAARAARTTAEWQMRTALLADSELLRQMEEAYAFRGVTENEAAGPRSRLATVMGAALVGLLLGLAVAWGREAALGAR